MFMSMKATIIYDTRYGNTEKVARTLEKGLKKANVESSCTNARDADAGSLKLFDLVCLGAPTEGFSCSKPMKEFIERLGDADVSGEFVFAFDTKLDWRISGSASKFTEEALGSLGGQVVAVRESALVSTTKEGGAIAGARLKEGEEERFEKVGVQVGKALLSRLGKVPA
jgi:flavodoxin